MLASASLLIIYIAVNISHLRLYKETGAKPWIIQLSLLVTLIFFAVLMYYEYINSKLTLGMLAITVFFCFFTEWVYRKVSGRTIKDRAV
jgi:L-asparagine transporter-like permease